MSSIAITITYASIYGTATLITSIVCAYMVRQRRRERKQTHINLVRFTSSKPHSPASKAHTVDQEEAKSFIDDDPATVDDEADIKEDPDSIPIEIKTDGPDEKWYAAIKEWFQLIMEKRQMYLSLIPHIFDQATDYGVAATFYDKWQEIGDAEYGNANPRYFFYVSVGIIIFHRLLSSLAIYLLTRSMIDAVLQIADILMAKAIWINYKLQRSAPSNPQRYLQILEASLESAPQILVSTAWILKTSTADDEPVSWLMIISILFSLWSLVGRVSSDDKQMFSAEDEYCSKWREIDFKYDGCPTINPYWFIRVFLWRFLEITSHVFLCLLIWVNLGGMALTVIFCFEFAWLLMACIAEKSIDPIANIMYLSYSLRDCGDCGADSSDCGDCVSIIVVLFWLYRIVSTYIYLILITIFALVDFEADNVESFSSRKYITTQTDIGLAIFIYTCCVSILWPFIAHWTVFVGYNNQYVVRDVASMVYEGNYDDAEELMEFTVTWKRECGSILQNISITNNAKPLALMKKIVAADPTNISEEHRYYPMELQCRNGGSLIHLAVMVSLFRDHTGWQARRFGHDKGPEILSDIFANYDVEINAADNNGNTALHILCRYTALMEWDMKNLRILMDHNINKNIKNNDNKRALEIIEERNEFQYEFGNNYYDREDKESFNANRDECIGLLSN